MRGGWCGRKRGFTGAFRRYILTFSGGALQVQPPWPTFAYSRASPNDRKTPITISQIIYGSEYLKVVGGG
jgi:hypothetical protein